MARSIYRKKILGAMKKSPMYLHEQTMVVRTELAAQQKMSTHPLNEVHNKKNKSHRNNKQRDKTRSPHKKVTMMRAKAIT